MIRPDSRHLHGFWGDEFGGEPLRRCRAAVDALLDTDPEIAALKPSVWADASGADGRVTAGTSDEAAARPYQRIARTG